MLEDTKVVIDDFGGLYYRGMDDTIPLGHFRVCNNASFAPRQISRRPGSVRTYNFGFYPRKLFLGVIDTSHFFLVLDDNKQVHRDAGSSIMSIGAANFDFAALNLYNRVYISPNCAGQNLSSEYLYVYQGGASARLAGGVKPATGVTCADGSTGVVSKGAHQFGVCFVTDTGFITPPNATLTTYTAPGLEKVIVSAIPTGDAAQGVVGRRIVCTKAGEEELFFVPGNGIINDNSTTSVTLDFADTDLVASADYLLDIYERIPSGTQLVFYKGRLVVVCADYLALVSNVQDPETFSTVDSFLAIPSEDYKSNPPVSGWVLRDTLYISKFPGVYGVQDSGDPSPNNWPVSVVDESVGCYPNGVGSYTAQYAARSTSDYDIILTQQGIYLFDGVFRRPPMTWKVEDLWQQIIQSQLVNPQGVNSDFWRMTLAHDTVKKRFYVNCSTADIDPVSGLQYFVLHGDYANGWDEKSIRWSMWNFTFRPSSIVLALHPIDNQYALRICSFLDSKMWTLTPGAVYDDNVTLTMVLDSHLIDKEVGFLTYFLGVQLRAQGNCSLAITLSDGTTSYRAVDLTVVSTYSKDFLRLTNYTSEKARLIMSTGGPIDINRIEVKCKPMFPQRPQL